MYVGVIITILSENRNPGKSLAYILAIVFLPAGGVAIIPALRNQGLIEGLTIMRKD